MQILNGTSFGINDDVYFSFAAGIYLKQNQTIVLPWDDLLIQVHLLVNKKISFMENVFFFLRFIKELMCVQKFAKICFDLVSLTGPIFIYLRHLYRLAFANCYENI